MISVILVQHNAIEFTKSALHSLYDQEIGSLEVILVDNASDGFEPAALRREHPELQVVQNVQNEGFGRANNRGAMLARGDVLLFLNTDTECREAFVAKVEKRFSREPSLGVLGPRLVYPDGSFQLSAGSLPSFGQEIVDRTIHRLLRSGNLMLRGMLERRYRRSQETGWVTGAALFIRASLFRRLGGFDETMFMYFEDKDLCKRSRDAGYRVVFDPSFTIMHVKAASSSSSLAPFLLGVYRESQHRYYTVHRPAWERLMLALYHRLQGVGAAKSSTGAG